MLALKVKQNKKPLINDVTLQKKKQEKNAKLGSKNHTRISNQH